MKRRKRRTRLAALGTLTTLLSLAAATPARADNCPLGSTEKAEKDLTWCEPSVCDTDVQCATGLLCRPVPLCVEVGTIAKGAATGDAGERLLARQRCGESKACPSKTTCSEKSRCITRAQAEKAGLLAVPVASSGSSLPPNPDPPKKSSCGCSVPGRHDGDLPFAALALVGGLVVGLRRRGRRVSG